MAETPPIPSCTDDADASFAGEAAAPPVFLTRHLETNSPSPSPSHIIHPRYGSIEHDHTPSIMPEESEFRHSCWTARRHQTHKALLRIHSSNQQLDAFCNCGADLRAEYCEAKKEARLRCYKCKNRWCVPCAADRAAKIRESVARALDGKFYRHIVLTLRASNTPLKDQLDRLYRSFLVFRRRDAFKAHVTGGVAVCEVKIGEKSGMWHPHLHILCEGSFWDQREISREWHSVTGDSSIVWICKPKGVELDASYLTKYITKPADQSIFAVTDMFDELIVSLKGRRLCTTFGTWRGIQLEPDTVPDGDWISLGSPETLLVRAREGDAKAIAAANCLARKYPLYAHLFTLGTGPPPWDVDSGP